MATPDRFALPQVAESTRKPEWLKVRMPHGQEYERVRDIVRKTGLATVCEEARCPNIAECWGGGTATVMLMGEVCTRACRFCHVKVGAPPPLDPEEPENLARAVRELALEYIVVTSVNRDDRPDGGASHFAAAIRALKRESPRTSVEVLIPDFKGRWDALQIVLDARPDVLNHNVETVPSLYRTVRAGASFSRSLELLRRSKQQGLLTKSGIMVGLGEEPAELRETIAAIRAAGTDILTVGQYLRPSPQHLPVRRYYTPQEFDELRELALGLGYSHVESGPLVRSSYHAESHVTK